MPRNKIPLLFVLALSACAHTEPVINTVIQKVEVPVPVPCKVEIPPPPDLNFNRLDLSSNIFDKVKALLADRILHLAYESELLVALKGCKDSADSAK